MKKWFLLPLTGLLVCSQASLFSAEIDEEQGLIQLLQSTTAGPAEKDAACARLKFVGTPHCVPALAGLLTDEQLSHSARYALEAMQFPEAGRALLEALGKTQNGLRVGIINSLAVRQQKESVPQLVPLLQDGDIQTAAAAARALGQIGGPEAVTALRASARNSPPGLHEAAVDALLRCANTMFAAGQRSVALAIFEQLDVPQEKEWVKIASFRGRVLASGNAGLDMVLHAISGPPGPSQLAALQLSRTLQAPHTTRELARLLPDLKPPVQNAMIECLAQRGDVTALPALKDLAAKASPEIRLPIIEAMDQLGDASVVPLLAAWAASGAPDVQKSARRALTDLHRGNITQMLIEQLSSANPAIQSELARALGARGDKAAVPRLLDLAQQGPSSARKGALQALSVLVDESQLKELVQLVQQAKEPVSRAESAEALNSAYQNILTQKAQIDANALVEGIQKGTSEVRCALLPICSGLVDPKVRDVLRTEIRDQDRPAQEAAVRALCDTIDGDLLQDLLQLVCQTPEDSFRTMAINGTVRLVTQEDTVKLPIDRRVAALKSLMACSKGEEQKRKVLAGLGEIPDMDALKLVEATLNDTAVSNEAARAAVKISTALPASQVLTCEEVLKKALASSNEQGTRQAVQAALNQIQNKQR